MRGLVDAIKVFVGHLFIDRKKRPGMEEDLNDRREAELPEMKSPKKAINYRENT